MLPITSYHTSYFEISTCIVPSLLVVTNVVDPLISCYSPPSLPQLIYYQHHHLPPVYQLSYQDQLYIVLEACARKPQVSSDPESVYCKIQREKDFHVRCRLVYPRFALQI